MEIILHDIDGKEKISGDYDSLVDCMVKNKDNLNRTDFREVDFRGLDFRGLDFHRSNFQESVFRGSAFQGSIFWRSDFQGSNFQGLEFYEANFQGADFREANFQGVDFRGSNFQGADFRGSAFWGANLRGSNFRGVLISIIQLFDANTTGVKLDHVLVKIQGSRHQFCGYGGMVKIGCEYHSVEDWLEHGAYTDEYSEAEEVEYMRYIEMYAKIWEEEKVESNTCEQ